MPSPLEAQRSKIFLGSCWFLIPSYYTVAQSECTEHVVSGEGLQRLGYYKRTLGPLIGSILLVWGLPMRSSGRTETRRLEHVGTTVP